MTEDKKRRLNVYLGQDMYDFLEKKSQEMGLSMSAIVTLAVYEFKKEKENK